MKYLQFANHFAGRTIDETFNNIKHLEVEPPSVRSPTQEIPAEADQVVAKALQKRPGERFQSMRDLIAALRAIET